jgi:uncharacterized protein (DUF1697 family)
MKMVALLRGINVGGQRKVPMTDLQALAKKIGFKKIQTYIQSGNLVFEAGAITAKRAEVLLEKALLKKFGFEVDVIVRTAREWGIYSSGSPFKRSEKARPHLLLLGLCKGTCAEGAVQVLQSRAGQKEKIIIRGDAVWVDFVASVAKSKLTPVLFAKALGSPVTMRNWKTVLKLQELLEED